MSPDLLDLGLLQHLPDDHLDVLVVDRHALEPVDLLDLVDEIVGQLLDALDRQDVVRRGMAVEQELALLDTIAFLHGEMRVPWGSDTRPARRRPRPARW